MSQGQALEQAIKSFQSPTDEEKSGMPREEVIRKSLKLVDKCFVAMLGSNSDSGYPNIKAMMKVETEGLKTFWFSTNTSSKRVLQFRKDGKACVYFVSSETFKGLMLTGDIEIISDLESKQRLWRDGCEIYYPLGVTDPDYTVLRFTAKSGNYYEGLRNISFEI